VSPPTRRGFGSLLLERSLAHDLEGKVSMDFKPDGLVCSIDAPLPQA
jgi:two-component sensor histidine kinase